MPAPVLLRALLRPGNPYRGVSLPRLVRYTRMARRGPPGKAVYSNLGVALLGHAVASAAGMSYWDLAHERVLHPLEMSSSGNLPTSALPAPKQAWDLAAFAPAGGLRASVPDLLRLAGVAADSANSPFPAAAADAPSPRVAMGAGRVGWCWMLSPAKRGPVYWHNGGMGASWAFIGAGGSCAIAAAVPAARQRAWDTLALQVLRQPANLAGSHRSSRALRGPEPVDCALRATSEPRHRRILHLDVLAAASARLTPQPTAAEERHPATELQRASHARWSE